MALKVPEMYLLHDSQISAVRSDKELMFQASKKMALKVKEENLHYEEKTCGFTNIQHIHIFYEYQ